MRRDETLSAIAAQMGSGGTLDQTMVALLRANPDAFIDGNINRLKAGAVLRMPGGTRADRTRCPAGERDRPYPDPGVARLAPRRAAAGGSRCGRCFGLGDEPHVTTASRLHSTAARVADARLEIVPPGASDATKAGTQSGISAGGEGAMLQQELTQTKETLAAREAESQELKSRVAELEKLQQQQQQLIAMKDSELAAAQQRLAQTQKQQPRLPCCRG